MAKATPLSKKNKNFFTDTVLRNTALNSIFMLCLYALLNLFIIILLNHDATRSLDIRLEHEIEHFSFAAHMENDSLIIDNPHEFSESALTSDSPTAFFLQIYDNDGRILFKSPNLLHKSDIPVEWFQPTSTIVFGDIAFQEDDLRVVYAPVPSVDNSKQAFIQLSTKSAGAIQFTPNLLFYNLASLPFVFLFIILSSFYLAKKSLKPISNVIDLANSISASNLKKRLTYEAHPNDELGRLRDTLNNLFDRLDRQIRQISQFTDNASHQLMSPLTVLKTELEFILRKPHENRECLETFHIMHEQTERMIHIVRTLLIIAKECDTCHDDRGVFNLTRIINALKTDYPLYPVNYHVQQGIYLRGNADYFYLVLQNLIDNAVKYSENGAPVEVSAREELGRVIICVSDQGIGIPEHERRKIFDRFYRSSNQKTEELQGTGLGLSLVHSIVTAMNGTIMVEDNSPKGSRFVIELDALPID